MNFSQRFFGCFLVGHKVFSQHRPRQFTRWIYNQQLKLPKATNSRVTPFSPSNLSESHSHVPPVGLHVHQLQLFILCLRWFQIIWLICGEMIRHVQSNTENTDLFFTKWQAATRLVYFFSACHLSLATIFGLVRRMEEQQDGSEVRAMEMGVKVMKSAHSKKLRFHFNWNNFQLKTHVLPILTCNVSSDFWMAGSRCAELIACACGSWKFTCHAA